MHKYPERFCKLSSFFKKEKKLPSLAPQRGLIPALEWLDLADFGEF